MIDITAIMPMFTGLYHPTCTAAWAILIAYIFIATEIIYFTILKYNDETFISEEEGVVLTKAASFLIAMILPLAIGFLASMILFMVNYYKIIVGSILAIFVIIGYIKVNQFFSKGKIKLQETYFKAGEKVKVKKPYVNAKVLRNTSYKKKLAGKIVTIDHIDKHSDCPKGLRYGIKEFPEHAHLEFQQIKKLK